MSLIRREVLTNVQRILLAALVVVGLAILSLTAHAIWRWKRPAGAAGLATSTSSESQEILPTATLEATRPPRNVPPTTGLQPQATPTRTIRIGIVAGHWQNDSGAVCEDGLTEGEINLSVAQRVVALLNESGYEAEILGEFSPKLNGYQAAAVVSIHSDSCSVPEATGFKVARVSSSVVPEIEDRLVACLIEKYHQATGLEFHQNSITYDMTEYHAFYEIAPETPAAIIEIGFMGADRHLLTKRQDRVAQGIYSGIRCFMTVTR